MDKKILLITLAIIVLAVAGYAIKINSTPSEQGDVSGVQDEYTSISSEALEEMLAEKDFVLIDVHTPEQAHIPDTDFMISYNKVDTITSVLDNKDAKVVLYCRSGSMSKIAAENLAEMGYTNVYELMGGLHDWTSQGRETTPVGSVNAL